MYVTIAWLITYNCVLVQACVCWEEQHQLAGPEREPSLQTSEDAGSWDRVGQLHR